MLWTFTFDALGGTRPSYSRRPMNEPKPGAFVPPPRASVPLLVSGTLLLVLVVDNGGWVSGAVAALAALMFLAAGWLWERWG